MTGETEREKVTRYFGPDHEMYVRKLPDGYALAVLNHEEEWEFDRVSEQWSPNTRFYPNSEIVPEKEFPKCNIEAATDRSSNSE